MSNPLLQAFFVGRAAAEILTERLEFTITDALSELGKWDAETREQMRQFTEEVLERANKAAETVDTAQTTSYGETSSGPVDQQAMIDELRAEIATLRTELQRFKSGNSL
ncbi:MAG: DUF6825 family protein [Brasilonema sp.]